MNSQKKDAHNNQLLQLTKTSPSLRNAMSRSLWRRTSLLLALSLACFALSLVPKAFGVNPPPDGGYPNENTAEGHSALLSLTTGKDNTAIGNDALQSNTDGDQNTATGASALKKNTNGFGNTASGFNALVRNENGFNNTATGRFALFSNTFGIANTAVGVFALSKNIGGEVNTAVGAGALASNTSGNSNTATGEAALLSNATGFANTGTGQNALFSNTSGGGNTAHGAEALERSTTGRNNTASGVEALRSNTTGNNNIALGFQAGENITTGSDNLDIANRGMADDSDTIRIGSKGSQSNTFIAGIAGVTVAAGVGVVIDGNGQLGTITSSERYKDAIRPMERASEAVFALEPVTFHYKRELDPRGIPQFGLVAEQVEKVNPNLVARDEEGKAYTVRYEAVNAMLLNEFLKEHRKVSTLEATITQQQKQIEALAAGLHKVNEKVALQKVAPRIVANQH